MSRPLRPRPIETADNEAFWTAVGGHRLVIQRCGACGRYAHPPRPMCPECGSLDRQWADSPGTGTVYSYSILHHPQFPVFDYPLAMVLVDLDEGVRMVGNLTGAEPAAVRIGMRVRVAFEPTANDGTIIVFAPDEPVELRAELVAEGVAR